MPIGISQTKSYKCQTIQTLFARANKVKKLQKPTIQYFTSSLVSRGVGPTTPTIYLANHLSLPQLVASMVDFLI